MQPHGASQEREHLRPSQAPQRPTQAHHLQGTPPSLLPAAASPVVMKVSAWGQSLIRPMLRHTADAQEISCMHSAAGSRMAVQHALPVSCSLVSHYAAQAQGAHASAGRLAAGLDSDVHRYMPPPGYGPPPGWRPPPAGYAPPASSYPPPGGALLCYNAPSHCHATQMQAL